MYIDSSSNIKNGKEYKRILLRHTTRIGPKKNKTVTIANLSSFPDNVIEAIRIALKHKDNLPLLYNLANANAENGKIYGSVLCLYQVASNLNFKKILGNTKNADLCLWLIMSRFLGCGSRLSSVRAATIHAGCEVIGIDSMTEDDLYDAMDWLADNKLAIEKRLFENWKKTSPNASSNDHIFLYDLSSSYLEGDKNEMASYGYNRDKKEGKKIITYGLLVDKDGYPLGIEVFPGNTADNKTVQKQISKIKNDYQAKHITFVGDKGMIKSGEQNLIKDEGCHYITTITKSQIRSLLDNGIFQMSLFDNELREVIDIENNVRYILRQNPIRTLEMKVNREQRISYIETKIEKANDYLLNHPKAKIEVQIKNIEERIDKLKLKKILKLEDTNNDRNIKLVINENCLAEISELDGCYVIKTDILDKNIDKKTIHERYKDLALIEKAFREEKSILNARGIFVIKENKTIAHVFTTMLAYLIEWHLRKVWADFNLTPIEAIETLKQIGSQVMTIGNTKILNILKPTGICKELLKSAQVVIPDKMPYVEVEVHTNRNLQSRRK